MKKFLKEFEEFALKGNVMNLAIGVIIGSAFQSVITSLTNNILSPLIGLVAGANFDGLKVDFLGIELKYGAFLTTLINFFIMSFVVFVLVKLINKLTQPEPAPKKPVYKCPYCLTEIDKKATRCPACTSKLNN